MDVVAVTPKDLFLLHDVGKLADACLIAALPCAALRFSLAGAAPFTILVACGTLFVSVYLISIHLLRIPTSDEYELIGVAIARYVPQSL